MQTQRKPVFGMFDQKPIVLPGAPVRIKSGRMSRFRFVSLQELGPKNPKSLMHEIVQLGKARGLWPLSIEMATAFSEDVSAGVYVHPQGQAWITLAVKDPEHPFVPLDTGAIIVNRRYNGKHTPRRYDPKTGPAWLTECTREFFIFEEPFVSS